MVITSAPPNALKSTCSTPAVSIVTFPGARRNLRRLPFADRSTRSATLAPLKRIVSFDIVAAVAGIPDEHIVARAHLRDGVAAVAVDRVDPCAADEPLGSGA